MLGSAVDVQGRGGDGWVNRLGWFWVTEKTHGKIWKNKGFKPYISPYGRRFCTKMKEMYGNVGLHGRGL